MSDVLLYDVSGGIATITLNRPDSLNALNEEISLALQKAIADAAGDREVRCVVITGAGRAFTSGADLSDVDSLSEGGAKPDLGELLRHRYNPVILPIVQMEKPVVASLNGVAAGAGASLALACDFRIATRDAQLGFPEVNLGQLLMLIRARFLIDAVGYDRVRGKPFRIAEIFDEAERLLGPTTRESIAPARAARGRTHSRERKAKRRTGDD